MKSADNCSEIVPHLNPHWDHVAAVEQKIWLAMARRTAPKLVALFRPRFVELRYAGPYYAELVLQDFENGGVLWCGLVCLMEMKHERPTEN